MPGRYYTSQDKLRALATVAACNGNYHEAERQLGINRQTLRSWQRHADESRFRAPTDTIGIERNSEKVKGTVLPHKDGTPRTPAELIPAEGKMARPSTDWDAVALHLNEATVALAGRIYEAAGEKILEKIDQVTGRDLAVTWGIASDKLLDHRYGRKGTQVKVEVDNRTVNAPATLDKLNLEELRAMLEMAKSTPAEDNVIEGELVASDAT